MAVGSRWSIRSARPLSVEVEFADGGQFDGRRPTGSVRATPGSTIDIQSYVLNTWERLRNVKLGVEHEIGAVQLDLNAIYNRNHVNYTGSYIASYSPASLVRNLYRFERKVINAGVQYELRQGVSLACDIDNLFNEPTPAATTPKATMPFGLNRC